MKRPSTGAVALGFVVTVALLLGYGTIFVFYVAGLFPENETVPARAWEQALRGTILLGPVLAAFLMLSLLAYRGGWQSGVLPWAAGALGVILLARNDAGILRPLDFAWAVPLLFLAWHSGRKRDDGEE